MGEGQAKILKCLLEQGSMTQRQLADKCMLDVTTMSRTLDKLQGAGYLLRTVNPSCRRSFLICITEKGKEKAASVQKYFPIWMNRYGREYQKTKWKCCIIHSRKS